MNKLERLIAEYRAGRVLSKKNEDKLRQAMEAMMEVLAQLEGDVEDDERARGVSLEQRCATITGLEIRAKDDKPTIRGHAALFDTPSVFMGFREQIAPGAFKDSLGGDIRALWQHDSTRVLGRTKAGTLRVWEDDQGLAFELNPPDTQDGRDAITLIERGDVDQMSFGFNVPSGGDTWDEDEDGIPLRTLRRVSLMEISPVTWAAYPQTGVNVVRNAPDWVQHMLTHGVDDSSTAFEHSRVRVTEMLIEHDLIFNRR